MFAEPGTLHGSAELVFLCTDRRLEMLTCTSASCPASTSCSWRLPAVKPAACCNPSLPICISEGWACMFCLVVCRSCTGVGCSCRKSKLDNGDFRGTQWFETWLQARRSGTVGTLGSGRRTGSHSRWRCYCGNSKESSPLARLRPTLWTPL